MQKCFMFHKDRVPDLVLYEVWDRIVDSGTERVTFSGGEAADHHSFRDLVRKDCNEMFLGFYEGVPMAVGWLNDVRDHSAKAHFTIFREGWGRKRDELSPGVKLARYFAASLLRNGVLDVLIGYVPVRNRLAVHFMEKVGAQRVGVLPKGAWMHDTQKSEDVQILAITEEMTEEAWLLY